ncbi:hypothetical protein ASPZODRAFT_16767 [Penicilliopsis zonata CBS 506.65]|uniref:Uncharacterized protein n=1 Tax=Penicilliopsis zonata CBS 506.65 TaxID=1073090 RepID=A0A1L9SG10_9EURO|nr:hypothetical protein ASPZODRAFT_16767 [Penicilliopsis zonata CBS 506.65]OJJ46170.1 hypothetical protein ASPZODRAFT_16767 [Penicilliopsis zonata CBS 506.65]
MSIIRITLHSSLLGALSAALAQVIKREINAIPILHGALYNFLSTPPNYLWGKTLEESFPVDTSLHNGHQKDMHTFIVNTTIKLVLDQSIGALLNTMLYITLIGSFRGSTMAEIQGNLRENTVPMLIASYKVWPVVSLVNLTVVPLEQRVDLDRGVLEIDLSCLDKTVDGDEALLLEGLFGEGRGCSAGKPKPVSGRGHLNTLTTKLKRQEERGWGRS